MSIQLNNQYGTITFDKQVLSQVAYQAAMECYGLVGIGYKSKVNGIVELLKGENVSKGVKIEEMEDGKVYIELYVVMQYGTNISTVANNVIDRVKYTVEKITSLKVGKIDINVQGIRVK